MMMILTKLIKGVACDIPCESPLACLKLEPAV